MASQNARLTLLRVIGEHEGEWSWYQFERAFPPGWFTDELPGVRAKDILDRLENEGLVTAADGGPQPKYRLTDRGTALFRETVIGSASA